MSITYSAQKLRTQNQPQEEILRLPSGQIATEIVIESGVTIARKSISEHNTIRKPCPAIAYDAAVVAAMATRGVQLLRVTMIETRRIYIIRFDEFQRNAVPLNRGYGDQLMLPLSHWSTPGQLQHSQQPAQLNMFEVAA